MDEQKLYVPDVHKWIDFFTKSAKDKSNSHSRYIIASRLRGGSLGNSASKPSQIIPLQTVKTHDSKKSLKHTNPSVDVTLVSPTRQVVEQAESELRREKKVANKRKGTIPHKSCKTKKGKKVKDNFD